MSEASSISSSAFADALARARQLAAKLSSSGPSTTSPPQAPQLSQGVKRSADDWQSGSPDSEPEVKRMAAALSDPFGAQLAAMKQTGAPAATTSTFSFPMMGISGSGKACTEEVHIPDGLVGLIIGRGGEQVSRIQAETGCKVQVAPDNGTGKDRSCYLQGSKDAIERAKELIMEIVSSKSHEVGRTGGAPASTPNSIPKPAPGSASIEMTIPGDKVGLIIGKGGETIRSLQDKSGTKMYILQDNMFEECDKPLRIVGEPDLVEHARQLVFDLITETPPKQEFFNNNKQKGEYGSGGGGGGGGQAGGFGASMAGLETMKFPVPKISVGLIIGKGGEMIKRIQMETGAKVQFDPINSDLGDMDEQLAIITGKSDQIRQAQLRIEDLVETALQGGKNEGAPNQRPHRERNNWGSGDGPPGTGERYFEKNKGGEEERMTVPVGRVGMVIGKGGETIRAINQQSGAHCEIDRNGPNDGPERIFLIRGSRQQIEYAKELILEKVNTLPPKPHQRGDRGGHHQGGGHYGQNSGGWGGYQQQQQQQQQQWGQPQQDPSKMADQSAQWAAYYAQYYGQQQAAAPAAAQPGQCDYTAQWVEYLRAQGNHEQANVLEAQMKASKAQDPPSAANGPSPPGTNPAANGAPGTAQAATNGQSNDYSKQWAEHYRSIGKIAEAEAIENYIKAQQAGGQPQQQQQPGYPGYYGQQQQPQPGYNPYGQGYPGQQQQQPNKLEDGPPGADK